ncbi:camp-dependent protein kinase pathway protein [Stemphylium lycopersici]|uniref:Camp-dependent protein kinase pathway protein n=1 Tax=Stemphylium lycopersici TaxID=183478 RepID=A0A364MZA5_STELY|nr:camp-dependent protein kinase pathway protein [Stemphylium lycopersici]
MPPDRSRYGQRQWNPALSSTPAAPVLLGSPRISKPQRSAQPKEPTHRQRMGAMYTMMNRAKQENERTSSSPKDWPRTTPSLYRSSDPPGADTVYLARKSARGKMRVGNDAKRVLDSTISEDRTKSGIKTREIMGIVLKGQRFSNPKRDHARRSRSPQASPKRNQEPSTNEPLSQQNILDPASSLPTGHGPPYANPSGLDLGLHFPDDGGALETFDFDSLLNTGGNEGLGNFGDFDFAGPTEI